MHHKNVLVDGSFLLRSKNSWLSIKTQVRLTEELWTVTVPPTVLQLFHRLFLPLWVLGSCSVCGWFHGSNFQCLTDNWAANYRVFRELTNGELEHQCTTQPLAALQAKVKSDMRRSKNLKTRLCALRLFSCTMIQGHDVLLSIFSLLTMLNYN